MTRPTQNELTSSGQAGGAIKDDNAAVNNRGIDRPFLGKEIERP